MATPVFHIILAQPEIPNNTGNIGRTAVATGCALHLIRPLGFDTGEKACRRAGLDYWPRLQPREHDSLDGCLDEAGLTPGRLWVLTTKAARPCWDVPLRRGDGLLFGRETRGLDDTVLARFADRTVALPMVTGERSLNLATAVCAVVYEGLRQQVQRGELGLANGRLILDAP
ncbi:MAG: tRNA (cytidine(34)-2'-O)-methyltransferase [Phycisphaerales bacterium]